MSMVSVFAQVVFVLMGLNSSICMPVTTVPSKGIIRQNNRPLSNQDIIKVLQENGILDENNKLISNDIENPFDMLLNKVSKFECRKIIRSGVDDRLKQLREAGILDSNNELLVDYTEMEEEYQNLYLSVTTTKCETVFAAV